MERFAMTLFTALIIYATKGFVLMLTAGALAGEGVIPMALGFWQSVIVVIAAGTLFAWDDDTA